MIENKPVSRRSSKSDLARVDRHAIAPEEYEELPELDDAMLARAVVKKAGRPLSANRRQRGRTASPLAAAFIEICVRESTVGRSVEQ